MFCVSGCDAAPAFEVQEGVLDEVSQFIEFCIVFSLFLAVFLWRDDGLHSLENSAFEDRIGIVPPIGKQHFRCYAVNQRGSLRAICNGTCRNNRSDRHTMRIHGQMYLGIEPPFVRLMS